MLVPGGFGKALRPQTAGICQVNSPAGLGGQ
jgi:hypothetical protein